MAQNKLESSWTVGRLLDELKDLPRDMTLTVAGGKLTIYRAKLRDPNRVDIEVNEAWSHETSTHVVFQKTEFDG